MSDLEENVSSGDDYVEASSRRMRKRRKTTKTRRIRVTRKAASEPPEDSPPDPNPFAALLRAQTQVTEITQEPATFEEFIEPLLPDLIEASAIAQIQRIKNNEDGHQIIPMTRLQSKTMLEQLEEFQSPLHAVIKRRLALRPDILRASILNAQEYPNLRLDIPLTPLQKVRAMPANPQVLEALYAIKTTPYESSFLSRLQGFQPSHREKVLAEDWDSRAPWMDLMHDIREHFALMHPDREQPAAIEAPIKYSTLHAHHLDQVHDILRHAFWDGIDVSDALQYSPEQCTVVASYKNLVVGVALLSSPQETYITYLAVKPGWDNAQIATSILYYLISLNPRKDITLHVSVNNPAVLLYNRFGFKAEEFIVGFYEDYLDPLSRESKNAFRLRLRQF
ncbi:hypothetical protein EIP86_008022 [Pleurotus ostreatoroseus]|nr:hypothetical protein EIP86_008022 [Pleurotus ostreatoroseus]